MNTRKHLHLFTFFFILFSSPFAWGMLYKLIDLSQLVAIAPRILLFTVTDQRIEYDQYESKFYVNYVTGQVEEGIKGMEGFNPGDSLTFKMPAEATDPGWDGIASPRLGIPKLRTDRTYFLFLASDSEMGMATPIGGSQGVIPAEQVNGEWVLPDLGSRKMLLGSLQNQVPAKALGKIPLGLGKNTNRYEDMRTVIQAMMEGE